MDRRRSSLKVRKDDYDVDVKTYGKSSSRELSQRNRSSTSANESYTSDRKYQPWMVEEKVVLLDAMKEHGCADFKNIAKTMGIRDEIEVKNYLEKNMERVRKSLSAQESDLEKIDSRDKSDEAKVQRLMLKPSIDLWKEIMSHMMFPEDKTPDYSNVIIPLLKQFAEEEEEVSDENYPDFKKLYLFLAECCSGNFAGDLKPMDSLILKTTLEKVSKLTADWEEETKLVQSFSGVRSFIPESYQKVLEEGSPYDFEQMHEQMKKLRKVNVDGIPLNDDAFNKFYQHMKLRENINPLGINPAILSDEEIRIHGVFEHKLDE